MVTVKDRDGQPQQIRTLLDSCAQQSFISERAAQKLRLLRRPGELRVLAINGTEATFTRATDILVGTSSEGPFFPVSATVTKRVTRDLPVAPVAESSTWPHINGLKLADPSYGTPAPIDMLLGADQYARFIRPGIRHGPNFSGPVAQNTAFGWVILGEATKVASTERGISVNLLTTTEAMHQFWKLEEVPEQKQRWSQ